VARFTSLRPKPSVEDRLHDLDEARVKRYITPDEYVKARSQVLSGH
jgi:hypothetical protein